MHFRIYKKVIKRFLKTVVVEELFLGEISLYKDHLNSGIIEAKRLQLMNKRKKDKSFAEKVLKSMKEANISSKDWLLNLIKVMKENGVENKKQQVMIKESSLKNLSAVPDNKFEEVIKYGI